MRILTMSPSFVLSLAMAVSLGTASCSGPETRGSSEGGASDSATGPRTTDPGAVEELTEPLREKDGSAKREDIIADDAVLTALQEVRTEPGDVPALTIQIGEEERRLPLEETHYKARLVGYVAEVEVRQTYRNPFSEAIETVYTFPLPSNSAVYDFQMEIGERVVKSEVQERAEARKTYEKARKKGHTAALLEQERPNVFTQSVANIEANARIVVVTRYVQDLTWDRGGFEFVVPMVVGPRFVPPARSLAPRSGTGYLRDNELVPDASRISPRLVGAGYRSGNDLKVEIEAMPGVPIQSWAVPTHRENIEATERENGTLGLALRPGEALPNRDLVLRYTVSDELPQAAFLASPDQTGKAGYFTLVMHPPELDVDKLVGNRELIFVVDVSGSMNGLPLKLAKRSMELALRQVRPDDTFNVITFASGTHQLWDAARPATKENMDDAAGFLSRLKAGGGTMLSDGVKAALEPPVGEGRHRYVMFLTDGYVGNEAQILADTNSFMEAMDARGDRGRVFGLAIGASPNRCLLAGLAAQGRGLDYHLSAREDPAKAVRGIFGVIDKPVLQDVQLDWGDLEVTETYPAVLPDLFATRPLVVHGRYQGAVGQENSIRLTGEYGWEEAEVEANVVLPPRDEDAHNTLGTLWARAKIDDLGTQLWDGQDPDVVSQITELGIEHRLMTPYTSFVAVDYERVVSDGQPKLVVQPVGGPEGVDPEMAGAETVGAVPAERASGDADGDGIPDANDRCPNEPEVFNGVDDGDGCPDSGKLVVMSSSRIKISEKVYFEEGTAKIQTRSGPLLDEIAAVLNQNPQIDKLEIAGHTDNTGDSETNLELSKKRAQAVVDALVERGVDAKRLEAKGYGDKRPIDANKTEKGRARNRRVEFRILSTNGRAAGSAQRGGGAYGLATCRGTWVSAAPKPSDLDVTVSFETSDEPLSDADELDAATHAAANGLRGDVQRCVERLASTNQGLSLKARLRIGADGAREGDDAGGSSVSAKVTRKKGQDELQHEAEFVLCLEQAGVAWQSEAVPELEVVVEVNR